VVTQSFCGSSFPNISLSRQFFLLQFPSQPFGGIASHSKVIVVPVRAIPVCQALRFFLFTFRRRHFSSVLLPPFCPPILEPDLKRTTI
jgi:hypothetical protein